MDEGVKCVDCVAMASLGSGRKWSKFVIHLHYLHVIRSFC